MKQNKTNIIDSILLWILTMMIIGLSFYIKVVGVDMILEFFFPKVQLGFLKTAALYMVGSGLIRSGSMNQQIDTKTKGQLWFLFYNIGDLVASSVMVYLVLPYALK